LFNFYRDDATIIKAPAHIAGSIATANLDGDAMD
jgi:hypothetical protein